MSSSRPRQSYNNRDTSYSRLRPDYKFSEKSAALSDKH